LRFRSLAVLRQQLLAIRQPADASAIDPACIATAIAAIDRAAMFYPRRAMCLQRSAVLTWLLRRQGIAADLVLGCRHTPFYAHAWVEVDRTVVNDTLRVKQLYPEIERI
jgi:hypothetical protein